MSLKFKTLVLIAWTGLSFAKGQSIVSVFNPTPSFSYDATNGVTMFNVAYSYTQQIYKSTEFAAAGLQQGDVITKLIFHSYNNNVSGQYSNWKVYAGITALTNPPTTFIPVTSSDLIYDSGIGLTANPNPNQGGTYVVSLTLSKPIVYTGSSNIFIAVDENDPGNGSAIWRRGGGATSDNRSKGVSSPTDIDPLTASLSGSPTKLTNLSIEYIRPTTKWNGSSWSSGAPTSSSVALLEANYSIATNESFGTLINLNDYEITIDPNGSASVADNLYNYGTIQVAASAGQYGQLKVSGSITNKGTITAYQYVPSLGHHGISSPMSAGFTTTSGSASALYAYDAATGGWDMNPTTTTKGKGFFAPVQASNGFQSAAGTFSVTGTPNTSHTHTLGYSTLVAAGGSGAGWNLIGNPYTCALDWTSVTISKTNINAAIYIWDALTSTYKYYVDGVSAPSNWAQYGYAGTQLTSGVIAPMQAFWVQVATNASASIVSTMANDGTVASTPTFYKTTPDNLILYAEDLSDQSLSDAMWITHASGYTNDFEGDRDAWKRSNYGGQANIYSYHNGEKMAINATDLSSSTTIPVGVKAPANGKKYKLVLEQIVNNQDYQVILEDKLFNSFTDISNQGYPFTSGLWQNEEPRFVLHVSQSTVGTEEDVASSIKAYQQGDRLIIQGNAQEHGRYSLVTLDGRQVAEGALQAGMANIEAPIAGVYILQITGAQSVAQRVIVQ